jgi:predicted O-methyltransferase YrrM
VEIYTRDVFSSGLDNFLYVKEKFGQCNEILEIGSSEGRSACWMLKNLLEDTGSLTCIEPFPDQQLRDPTEPFPSRQLNPFKNISCVVDNDTLDRFNSNIAHAKQPKQIVNLFQEVSYTALSKLIVDKKQFDFIYIDGCHWAQSVLTDACMCFGILKPQGFMLFDDYLLQNRPNVFNRPKIAIDAFVNIFSPDLKIHKSGYQVLIQKKA